MIEGHQLVKLRSRVNAYTQNGGDHKVGTTLTRKANGKIIVINFTIVIVEELGFF